jgi:hypothetical protein
VEEASPTRKNIFIIFNFKKKNVRNLSKKIVKIKREINRK